MDTWVDKEDMILCTHTHTHTHTQWNITQPLKEWNNVTCSNMDGPRDYHTKWNKADRERQIYEITYMWNLKKYWYKWIYLQNINRPTDIRNKSTVTKRESRGRDKWGIGD